MLENEHQVIRSSFHAGQFRAGCPPAGWVFSTKKTPVLDPIEVQVVSSPPFPQFGHLSPAPSPTSGWTGAALCWTMAPGWLGESSHSYYDHISANGRPVFKSKLESWTKTLSDRYTLNLDSYNLRFSESFTMKDLILTANHRNKF